MYFCDADSVRREFEPYGLVEFSEIDEPSHGGVALPFLFVICKRDSVVRGAHDGVARGAV